MCGEAAFFSTSVPRNPRPNRHKPDNPARLMAKVELSLQCVNGCGDARGGGEVGVQQAERCPPSTPAHTYLRNAISGNRLCMLTRRNAKFRAGNGAAAQFPLHFPPLAPSYPPPFGGKPSQCPPSQRRLTPMHEWEVEPNQWPIRLYGAEEGGGAPESAKPGAGFGRLWDRRP